MKKILFITPTFARTGSEMVLWYLITNLDPAKYKIHLFSVQKGELFDVLPEHIGKTTSYKYSGSLLKKAGRGILKTIGVNVLAYQLKRIHKQFKPDLWFVNTIVVPDAHLAAKDLNVKLVTYFHEAENAFGFIKDVELKRVINVSYCCLGCSEIVVEKIKRMGHKNVKLQNSFINDEMIEVDPRKVDELKKQLGINDEDFVWVISGTAHYIKGIDLILPVLEYFKNKPVKIIWIGGSTNTGLDYYVKTVVESQYSESMIFTGPISDGYYNYLAMGNGLLMLSREECFPLVMIEASLLGLPIVSFDAGIIKTFVEEGMGKVVTGSNCQELCEAMEFVQNHPETIDRGKLQAKGTRFTVKKQIPQFQITLEEILGDGVSQ